MSESSLEPGDKANKAKEETDGQPSVSTRRYSRAQLALHDGSDPSLPLLIAYKGLIYDVTASFPWASGIHWGDHRAGQDLTGCLKETIHGEEMLLRVPCVGVLDG